jgi:hypothetical protein
MKKVRIPATYRRISKHFAILKSIASPRRFFSTVFVKREAHNDVSN